LRFAAVDDNTNSVSVWHFDTRVSPKKAAKARELLFGLLGEA